MSTATSRLDPPPAANSRARHCCQRSPLDTEWPDARREPPPQDEHDRRRHQRAIGVAHRQTNAADLGVKASRPRHHARPQWRASGHTSRGRSLHAGATVAGQSQSGIGHGEESQRQGLSAPADSTSDRTSSTLGAAAPCVHPGTLRSSSRGSARRSSPVARLVRLLLPGALRPGDATGPLLAPVLVNLLLFSAFALHHSALARSGAKETIRRIAPPELERSLYTWVASLLFLGRLHLVAAGSGPPL